MKEIRKPDATLAKLLPAQKPRPSIKYIPSQFAYPFERDGRQYIYNTLTKQLVETTLPTQAGAGEGYDELIEGYFLVPEGKDECAFYESISTMMRAYTRKKAHRGYTILPTLACNARCVYCYEEGLAQVTMTPETVEQTIRFILETCGGKSVKLSWFGGEPLLRPDIISRVCEGMRQAGLEYRSSMISNGSLITPEIIQRMTGEWKVGHIQISMDGAERDYISRKRYYADHDDYHGVMGAISMLSAAGISVTIRCNVDEDNWGGIPQYLDDLKAGVEHKEKVGVYFAPLNAVRLGKDDISMWEKVRDARSLIEAAGFRAAPFMGLVQGFRTNHCMADCNGVVICPDGSLYPCEHCPPESRYGDIWRGTTDAAAKQAFCRVDRTREKCKKCPLLPECTSFATCPVHDTHCRDVREMMALDALKRMVEKKESENADGEDPIC